MKKISFILSNFLLFTLTLPGIDSIKLHMPDMPQAPKIPAFFQEFSSTERKIVVFKDTASEEARQQALGAVSAKVIKKFNLALKADVLEKLNAQEESQLLAHPAVSRIDPDITVEALWHLPSQQKQSTDTQSTQSVPWGVDRIDADLAWNATNTPTQGLAIKVAVIDTGIELSHPDLAANIKGGINTIYRNRSANDDNGHGTHVAGTIAALNNTYGVVGVGPQIYLYAVKALDSRGRGWLSDIIEGIDWSIANKMQVINMSLGTTGNVKSFHDAVIRAKNAGIVIVAAAGNNGDAVNYPAAYEEVIAVSAVDSAGNIAAWSSRGPEVDLAAPGVSIYSTYRRKSYATLSGTSMAAPHVAGTAALVLAARNCTVLLQTRCTPNDIQARLEATAEQLPQDSIGGKDSLYGSGLVDAFAAVYQ